MKSIRFRYKELATLTGALLLLSTGAIAPMQAQASSADQPLAGWPNNDEGFCNDFLDRDVEIAYARARQMVGPNIVNQAIYVDGADARPSTWLESWTKLQTSIQGFKQPLVHGTQSGHLATILSDGLGATQPAQSWRPNQTYFCDLTQPDGWMGSYAFATRGDFSAFAVRSEEITGHSIYKRFGDVSPFAQRQNMFVRWLMLKLLKRTATRYAKFRGPALGSPMMMIFDGENQINVRAPNPDRIPELVTTDTVSMNYLRVVMVPVSEILATEALLKAHGLDQVQVLAIELAELDAIRTYREKRSKARGVAHWFSGRTLNNLGSFQD